MKRAILLLVVVLGINANAQQIVKYVDSMEDKVYYYQSEKMLVANEAKDKGFVLAISVNNKTMQLQTIMGTVVGLGSCIEDGNLIILFEGGDRITITNWKDFNCDGETYYNPTSGQLKLLKTKKIVKMRVTNGRTYESYTKDIEEEDQSYFINLLASLDSGDFIEVTE